MRKALLLPLTLVMFGCPPADDTPPGTGGSQGSSGGATGSGGASSGGATGSGGASSGGATGSGGASSGGATGSGGDTGSGGGGGGTGSGGRGDGGGATGGRGTGGAATGGAATGGAGTGGASMIAIPDLFPMTSATVGSLDGRLVVMPCGDENTAGTDCGGGGAYYSTAGSTTAARINCSGPLNVNQVFNVGGEAGRMYNVTIHFYGIAEPKNYGTSGVMREATNRPANTTDTTGAGATPTAWASAPAGHTYPGSDYNTNEIRVCRTRACMPGDEVAVYYLNADTGEGHYTFVINYEKNINVIGGGAVRVRNYDANCRQIKNCGPNGTPNNQCATMANRRVITVTGAMPAPSNAAAASGGLLQPNLVADRTAGASGQWLLIDVVRINSVM